MPKYYRFRATSPTRKPKRSKDKERQVDKTKFETERDWIDLTVSCTPVQSWYMRRIGWREGSPFLIPPKQMAHNLYTSFCSLQLTDRPDRPIVIKFPMVRSQFVMRF